MRKILLGLSFASMSLASEYCMAAKNDVESPNGDLKVIIESKKELDVATFSVLSASDTLVSDVKLGLQTDQRSFFDKLKLKSASSVKNIVDDYQMLTGKRSHCVNRASERTFTFENEKGQLLKVTFRAYDDGVVFRYSFDAESGENITSEQTAYPIRVGSKRWMQQYDTSYEGAYPLNTTGESQSFRNKGKWGYPALVELRDNKFMLITEANIRRDNCGSYLSNADASDSYRIMLGDEKLPVKDNWTSAWRVMIIGSPADIVESTLVTDVSDPAKYSGQGWVKPGLVSWIYWANNHGSKDYQIIKQYIDLASDMHWPYDLVDWEWDQMANGGNIDDALSYAKEKNVKLLLWYNSSTSWIGQGAPGPLYKLNDAQTREKEYQWLVNKGFVGMKIDFFPGDDVKTMNYYMDLMEGAAAHHIMVNFHGATVPRGWQRTYPNMMSVEGVYGAEWYNNGPAMTKLAASHNAILPFTRNVVGPMDYTPGTFSDSQNPHITTNAHELALVVLFESALQHMPDRPSVYKELNVKLKGLLSEIPTAWDDIHFISGYPAESVVLARRKGDVWYVAGINGTEEAKRFSFNTGFAGKNKDEMILITDGNGDRDLDYSSGKVADQVSVECMPRGGFLAIIK